MDKFWDEDIQNKIPNKLDDDIYAIYTEHETDFIGPYTVIIGLPLSSLEEIPGGFVGIIEKAAY